MPTIFKSPKRTAGNKWLETINPINALSITEARSIYDAARRYGSPRLQKIYDEIELTDPVLMTCVERRQSALAGLGWQVKSRASADATLADEQRDAADAFIAKIDNFTDALCHLDLAYFRGFAHCQPLWEGNAVRHIGLLNSWNFLTDEDGAWLWNPCCSIDPRGCYPITPEARLMSIVRRRAIDYPALAIYIRKALGERDWGRFIERYGIPPVDVVMAPNTTEEQRDDYLESAERARDGLPTAWPSGSAVSRAEGSRGQDPFSAFIEHQEKLIVLAATGGTLTSLAQADTGTLAGGAQMDVWREIVLRDALVVADVVERALVRPFVEAAFPGKPFAISFELGVERKPTSLEAAQLAGAIRAAGYIVDQAELEQATGFKLEREESPAMPGMGLATARGAERSPRPTDDGRARAPSRAETSDLLAAFAADNGPLAEAIKALLNDPSTEAAEKLLADLPTLLPDDPALAAVIAEEMAKEFGDGMDQPASAPMSIMREYKRERDGKFSEVDHPRDFKPGKNPDSAETQAAEIGKGKKAIEKCLTEQVDVPNAISRGDIGLISLVYKTPGEGDNVRGMVRFLQRPEAREHLAETLVRGEAIGPYQDGQKLNLKHGGYVATLRLTSDEKEGFPRNWVLTGYGPEDKTNGGH